MVECTDGEEQWHAEKTLSCFGQRDMANLKDLSSSRNANIVRDLKTLLINKNVPFSFDTKLLFQMLSTCKVHCRQNIEQWRWNAFCDKRHLQMDSENESLSWLHQMAERQARARIWAQLHLLKLHSSHLRTEQLEQVDGSPASSARWWTNLWTAAQDNLRRLQNAERHQWASSVCWRHFWGNVIKNVPWCHDSTLSLLYETNMTSMLLCDNCDVKKEWRH